MIFLSIIRVLLYFALPLWCMLWEFTDIFKKKFKVRVKYFGEDKYAVEWTHYRLTPVWYTLNIWFNSSPTSGIEAWTPKLSTVNKAEEIAKNINCIEDVEKWYIKHIKNKKDFYKHKEEYYKKHIPYKIKEL